MTQVPVRGLRNTTGAPLRRVQEGEQAAVTVDGRPAVGLASR